MDVRSMMNAPSEGYHLSDNRSETRILEMSDHHHTSSISSDTGVVIDQKLDLASGQTLYLPPLRSAQDAASMPASPAQAATSKSVVFHVLCPQSPETPARLPLRLNVRPHDTTESLMSTIRNFHGLWDTPGTKVLSISLEDQRGSTIIPRYENFEDDMAVYVRATLDSSRPGFPPSLCARANGSPIAGPGNLGNVTDEPRLYEHQSSTFPMLKTGFQGYIPRPPMIGVSNQLPQYGHMVSGRPELHLATRGEPLSLPDGRYGPGGETGAMYSDSDEGPASTAGSKKEIVSAEISLDNIVAGARRKRVNKGFESSQLPLFAPSQIPLAPSYNSISPVRQGALTDGGQSLVQPSPSTMSNMYALQSPYGSRPAASRMLLAQQSPMLNYGMAAFSAGRRATDGYPLATPKGILPTPDMTIASHISDEDVAIQLMRLGDTSNVSRSNRNSASTVGGMTGHDVETSSEAETDDDSGQHDHHQRKKVKVTMPGSASYGAEGPHDTDYSSHNDDANDRSFGDQGGQLHVVKAKSRSKPSSIRVNGTTIKKSGKTSRPPPIKKSKIITLSTTNPTGFISPTSMSAHSRKHSLASTINFANGGLNGTGEDLSAMPRCQRCRKSKKGCDRKRPCGRCKEAGIGPEGCVSEEEGNGRKGRYGRQMGSATKVGPKKAIGPPPAFPQALPAPVAMTALGAPADNYAVSTHANVDFALGPDRKRKREDE